MILRHGLSRRDAFLVLIGAFVMYVWSALSLHSQRHLHSDVDMMPEASNLGSNQVLEEVITTQYAITTKTLTQTVTSAHIPQPTNLPANHILVYDDVATHFPHTSIVAHAPGWTLFRNLYMSNGTLYILSSNWSFPPIRMMTSTGLPAANTPENIALREPTTENMDFITPEDAAKRWGGDVEQGEKNRVWTVQGNTFLFNDPSQFLRHYYHLVAELFFGAWAFWHGAWATPTTSTAISFVSSNLSLPHVDRAIFAHSDANGWRDDPGFNAYFLRTAFPSLTVEVQEDWNDRIAATSDRNAPGRAWHFPMVLLADRSAAFRGVSCGSQNQRTAAEAWDFAKRNNQLMGERVGGWWDPIRRAVWQFAGVPQSVFGLNASEALTVLPETLPELALPIPDKVVITYISRQGGRRRRLLDDAHDGLVTALTELVKSKGPSWEFNIMRAETMTKDEQIKAVARTTILLGVHGNGLTHLVFMKPTRVSAVIEIFYPEGFAHDYQWTTRALGMDYYGVWKDRHFTHETKPQFPNYPEPGFQGDSIPVDGRAVARLVEEHVTRRSV